MANTEKMREASRVSYARKRFERWAEEMRQWGCIVQIPDHLTVPERSIHAPGR